ncbi:MULTISPECIES: hypothetical protein [Gracilibacillus]|uniref:hypothetical protein n=1 Tax=Gracilibacillus TaxID=74385 RepID=UPI0008269696|nr:MULTISPECIES: hypothetical protein [Gracilibacillus]
MKKIIFIILFIAITIFLFWRWHAEPEISKEEAVNTVIEEHMSNTGEIKILSIQKRWGNYIVEWENKQNCEKGKNTIDGINAEIRKGKVSVC